jgi:predicted RNase H-like nuclease
VVQEDLVDLQDQVVQEELVVLAVQEDLVDLVDLQDQVVQEEQGAVVEVAAEPWATL